MMTGMTIRRGVSLFSRGKAAQATRVLALLTAVAYLLGVSWYLLTHGGWPTVDYLIPPLLLLALALGRGWAFVLDWGPFLLLVLLWQATAGIADSLGRPVHVRSVAEADYWLFRGHLPSFELQQRLFDPERAHWYDWAATLQHAMHFLLPVLVGLAIWLHSRRTYWRYMTSVLVLFTLGFAIYALYPAAPPWMAGLYGATPPVDRIAVVTVQRLPTSAPIGLAYTHFNPNEVAAVPSLHAALPMLIALVLVRLAGVRALPALLYPALIGLGVVYLGEHYVIDVLLGYGVALIAFALVWVIPALIPLGRAAWRPRLPAPSPLLRHAGSVLLPALAVASVAIIGFSLRPSRPTDHAGPVIPGLQVQAGRADTVSLAACDDGQAVAPSLNQELAVVAERYAIYLFDLDETGCAVAAASETFPPPRGVRAAQLAERAPVDLAELRRTSGLIEHYALRVGTPAPLLTGAGLIPEHRYLALVALGGVPDTDSAAIAVDNVLDRWLLAAADQ
jgi:hypothetical protein